MCDPAAKDRNAALLDDRTKPLLARSAGSLGIVVFDLSRLGNPTVER